MASIYAMQIFQRSVIDGHKTDLSHNIIMQINWGKISGISVEKFKSDKNLRKCTTTGCPRNLRHLRLAEYNLFLK